jgi:hypothetical protein
MYLNETGYEVVKWIVLGQNRVHWRIVITFGFHKRRDIR